MNYVIKLLFLHVVNHVRQRHERESPGTGQIAAELIAAGNSVFGVRRNFHRNGMNQSFRLFMKTVIKLTILITRGYHCYQLYKIVSIILPLMLT